ncbi:hypothetical protein [Cryobacterium sp. 10C3]|uniref:hypothetical protein n=1 Tax=Cryobacterium sp. 10C3 TaxID=3048577 RepID=UPI002AB52D4F|nr:hypothetical protein [Cryobacterium sp. 10C3]MDY7557593.1 hypothetical protein [Cryobacterium sp. 10C3]
MRITMLRATRHSSPVGSLPIVSQPSTYLFQWLAMTPSPQKFADIGAHPRSTATLMLDEYGDMAVEKMGGLGFWKGFSMVPTLRSGMTMSLIPKS